MKSRKLQNEKYAKTVQLGNASRDYLILYCKVSDCWEQFIELSVRDYGERIAEDITGPLFKKYFGPLLNELKHAFVNSMIINLSDYDKQEL